MIKISKAVLVEGEDQVQGHVPRGPSTSSSERGHVGVGVRRPDKPGLPALFRGLARGETRSLWTASGVSLSYDQFMD